MIFKVGGTKGEKLIYGVLQFNGVRGVKKEMMRWEI